MLLALACAAPAAHAATASVSDGVLTYTAAPGESNRVALSVASGSYGLADPGVAVSPGPGCAPAAFDRAACPTGGIAEIVIDLGDGSDTATISTSASTTIADGSGDDTVTGGSGADVLIAGPGADTLSGGSGNDTIFDSAAASSDVFNGGSGTDRVSYAGRSAGVVVSLDDVANDGAAGESDNARLDVEQVEGSGAADTLTGSGSANRLLGGYGDDALNGGSGDDQLDGGPGADVLQGGAGTRDVADYSARTNPVTATLDDQANDGETGERDNARTDVEGIWGGAASDRLTGGGASDDLRGGDGDDTFRGLGGADTMSGGSGQDTADYGERTSAITVTIDGVANDAGESDNVGTDVDNLIGGSGDDRLTGSSWWQTIDGGPGDDTLYGGGSNDTLEGGSGDDTLNGDSGDDVIDGGAGRDDVNGGSGADTADYSSRGTSVSVTVGDASRGDGASGEGDDVGSDIERVLGGPAADSLTGNSAANTLLGSGGDDALDGGSGDDGLQGGDGSDRLSGASGRDAVDGGSGDDRLDGGSGSDTLTGGDGTDTLDYSSRTGNLTVDGDNSGDDGESSERDNARSDIEVVLGGAGSDKLTGSSSPNRIYGGPGDDTIKGGGGADAIAGGDGRDTADYSDRRNPVAVSLSDGANDGEAGEDDDVAGDVETVKGGAGDDRLFGSNATDTLSGGGGEDLIAGGDADDRLLGGDGDDVIQGGPGADGIDAGGGTNTIDFSDRSEPVAVDLDANADSDGDEFDDAIDNAVGGSAADRLTGGDGDNLLVGGGGDDTLDGDRGADRLMGGDGTDTADYSRREGSVTVTLDGNADDGEGGERDTVQSDVEAVTGGRGGDTLKGSAGSNLLAGGPGDDTLVGGKGVDRLEGGKGSDLLRSKDGVRENALCGSGRDGAVADRKDDLKSCERQGKPDPPPDGTSPTPPRPQGVPGVRVHIAKRHGGVVAIPGFPGERVDRRLLRDVRWLRARYRIYVTDGYARSGHAPNGEHPLGVALDIVPGPGGSWRDIDRLARFAEPRQNHPRAPWRWVGYNGDVNHGRGNHLHLSWNHAPARPGHSPRWVQVLTGGKPRPTGGPGNLRALAKRSNQARGGYPRVRSRIATVQRCSGARPLVPTWKAAAKAFGLRWQILAAITQVESGLGCNMGPSSAGAIGWTQFMPATWRSWGMDANGDGKASPYNSVDAIFSTARYLRASGAPGNYRRALFAYNHAGWYVNLVLRTARNYRIVAGQVVEPPAQQPLAVTQKTRGQIAMRDRGFGIKPSDPTVSPYLKPPVRLSPLEDETLYEGAGR